MNAPLYTMEILRLAARVPDRAQLAREDGRAELRSPTCGSRVAVAVQMANARVEAIDVQVEACAFGQAATAIMVQGAVGRTRAEVASMLAKFSDWLREESEDEGGWPGLAALAPARRRAGRHGAMLLPFRALLAAIDEAGK